MPSSSRPTQKQLLFAADALFLDIAANAPTKILLSHFSSTQELVIRHQPAPYTTPCGLFQATSQSPPHTGINAVRSYFDLLATHWERSDLEIVDGSLRADVPARTVHLRASVEWIWRLSRRAWVEEFACMLVYDENLKVVRMDVETTSGKETCVMCAVDGRGQSDIDRDSDGSVAFFEAYVEGAVLAPIV
ncbi:hypothetical protein MKEN_00951100 [Mycena kentingensis (nom. inval.)]|nr:hypothetical protein MKEN_00951100 [Mycena kentingensis (nom. inval.)]